MNALRFNSEIGRKQKDFFRQLSAASRSLLLLDYDGTLADFRINRFTSRPWAGVQNLLREIQTQGRTRMAVITGRPAREIAPMLGLNPPLEVWGLHGAERLYPDGQCELEEIPQPARTKLEALKVSLRKEALGGLFEDKANGAVMHWRGKKLRQAAEIERRTRELFEPLAKLPGLALLDFESGLELRAGRNKGGAVEAILAEAPATPVAYLGDDFSDEAAFQAVNCARGLHISALVRRTLRKTSAEIWLRPPAELRAFLAQWIKALSE